MHYVFVYGTLKRGFCRHHVLENETFLGEVCTEPLYLLYDLGNYPGLIKSDSGHSVTGEVYLVDDACLKQLDTIEAVGESLYSREPVQLAQPWNDLVVQTYIYQQPVEGLPQIDRWTKHTETNQE